MDVRKPIEVKRKERGLDITWSDGHVSRVSTDTLRKACPCAECRVARGDGSHEKPLSFKRSKQLLPIVESTHEEATALEEIWPVGNYALGMRWSDGHSTGIYPFTLLAELALKELTG